MIVRGKATFLEARKLTNSGLVFGVFGFDDFDRREFLVPEDVVEHLPLKNNVVCDVTLSVLKRFDGKEDMRLTEVSSSLAAVAK